MWRYFIIFLLFVATPVMAETWVNVARNANGTVVHVDYDSLRRISPSNVIIRWKSSDPPDLKMVGEYNCVAREYRTRGGYYEDQWYNLDDPWQKIGLGTISERVYDVVCK